MKFNNVLSKRVLVYGIGDSGVITYNTLINNISEKFKVVGFIDDSHKKITKHINGIPIWPESKINKEFTIIVFDFTYHSFTFHRRYKVHESQLQQRFDT